MSVVVLSNRVSILRESVFDGCLSLVSVSRISNSVTNIDARAFRGCENLQRFNLPNRVTIIGTQAFYGCSSFTIIGQAPGALTHIGSFAFANCTALDEFDLDQSALTWIGASAFRESGIRRVITSGAVERIENDAFRNAYQLTTVEFVSVGGTLAIGTGAFSSTALTEVKLPARVVLSGTGVFSNNPNLTNIKGGPFSSTQSNIFQGCGCSNCPNVSQGGKIQLCSCIQCNTTTRTIPSRGGMFVGTDDDDGLDLGGTMEALDASMEDTAALNQSYMRSLSNSARELMATRRQQRNQTMGPADTRRTVAMLRSYRRGMWHVADRDTIGEYIDTVANMTGEIMAVGADQSDLDVPLASFLQECLVNANMALVNNGNRGTRTYNSTWAKTRVEVQDLGVELQYTDGIGASFVIPATSMRSSNNLIGATFTEYLDSRIHYAELNASESQVTSTIMSVDVVGSLEGIVQGVFDHTVNLDLDSLTLTKYKPVCVFYVEPQNGSLSGSWSSVGCTTTKISATHTQCTCTHLTSFAVLVTSEDPPSDEDARALSIITYIGVAMSLVGIVLTIGTVATVKVLRKQLRYQILLNLVAALGMSLLFFCLLTTPTTTASCEFVSFGTLYFVLASLLWNVVDAYDLWKTFVVVFNDGQARAPYFLFRFQIFAWGGAFVPPVIALIVDRPNFITTSTTANGEEVSLCWINMATPVRWTFLAPLILVLVLNLRIATQVISEIRNNSSHKSFRAAFHTAKVVANVSVATGLAWFFGVLVIISPEVTFSYLFAFFASSQGATLFYYHVVENSLSRQSWTQAFKRLSSTTSLTSQSDRYHRGVSSHGGAGKQANAVRWKRATASMASQEDGGGITPGLFWYRGSHSENEHGSEHAMSPQGVNSIPTSPQGLRSRSPQKRMSSGSDPRMAISFGHGSLLESSSDDQRPHQEGKTSEV